MPSIPLLLQNDQILYDALLQAGALSAGIFPPENSFFGKLAFRKRSFSWLWNAFVSKKFCSRLPGDPIRLLPSRFSCIITIFAVLAKCWNIPTAPLQ